MNDKLLRISEVEERVALDRSTIYRMMHAGNFPLAIKLSTKAVRWSESALQAWIESRPTTAASPDAPDA